VQRLSYQVDNNKIAIAVAKLRRKFPTFVHEKPSEYGNPFPLDPKRLTDKPDYRRYVRTEIKDEEGKLRTIMLEAQLVGGRLNLEQIPGVHDVTGSHYGNEPYHDLVNILTLGFSGGPYCNVAILGPDPVPRFKEFEYNPPEDVRDHFPGKHEMVSHVVGIEGDRYRLLLWTGFSENYVTSHWYPNPYYEGRPSSTVIDCPPSHIEPFIILEQTLTEVQIRARVAFYRTEFEKLGKPLPKFLFRGSYEAVPDRLVASS
jgi:hypothetical protein